MLCGTAKPEQYALKPDTLRGVFRYGLDNEHSKDLSEVYERQTEVILIKLFPASIGEKDTIGKNATAKDGFFFLYNSLYHR